jgi:hypothetical protein
MGLSMTDRSLNDAVFWESVVSIAADDPHLVCILGGVILDMVTIEDDVDYADVQEYLGHKYGLRNPARVDQAFSLCEERILGLVP